MARSSPAIRRPSLERIRLIDNEENPPPAPAARSNYRPIQCSFCPETFGTTAQLGEHLLTCGNKTDQCPLCHQFIRRAYFAYHYENNCAQVKDTSNSPASNNRRGSPRQPPNANQPFSREDISADPSKENQPPTIPLRRPVANGSQARIPVVLGLKTPVQLPLRGSPSTNRQTEHSNGIVHIPCEICQEPIDLPNWSIHTNACREKDNLRLAQMARQIGAEPVTEALPCEYCHRSFAGQLLRTHEENCPQNPTNRGKTERGPHAAFQPIHRASTPRSQSAGRNRERALYQSVDVDRTHAANQPARQVRRSNSADVLGRTPPPEPISLYENEGRYSPRGAGAADHYYERPRSSSEKSVVRRSQIGKPTVKPKKKSLLSRLFCAGKSDTID